MILKVFDYINVTLVSNLQPYCRVHKAGICFILTGRHHQLGDCRYEIYISQMAMNLFPSSVHYHFIGQDYEKHGGCPIRNINCFPFTNICINHPSPVLWWVSGFFLVFCVVVFVLFAVVVCRISNVAPVSGLFILDCPFSFL